MAETKDLVLDAVDAVEQSVTSWTSEILNAMFSIAENHQLPEGIKFEGISLQKSYRNGDTICVNFQFSTVGSRR